MSWFFGLYGAALGIGNNLQVPLNVFCRWFAKWTNKLCFSMQTNQCRNSTNVPSTWKIPTTCTSVSRKRRSSSFKWVWHPSIVLCSHWSASLSCIVLIGCSFCRRRHARRRWTEKLSTTELLGRLSAPSAPSTPSTKEWDQSTLQSLQCQPSATST